LVGKNGRRLELDGFCPELSIAFEHQGKQHRTTESLYSGSEKALAAIQGRDLEKLKLCGELDIRLISFYEVPQKTSVEGLIHEVVMFAKSIGIEPVTEVLASDIDLGSIYSGADVLDELSEWAQGKGGEVLETTFPGPDIRLHWRCSVGHVWERSSRKAISAGKWCPVCGNSAAMRTKIGAEQIARSKGGFLRGNYDGWSSETEWECVVGHRWNASPGTVAAGNWCVKCGPG
jgi:hypothetical protein